MRYSLVAFLVLIFASLGLSAKNCEELFSSSQPPGLRLVVFNKHVNKASSIPLSSNLKEQAPQYRAIENRTKNRALAALFQRQEDRRISKLNQKQKRFQIKKNFDLNAHFLEIREQVQQESPQKIGFLFSSRALVPHFEDALSRWYVTPQFTATSLKDRFFIMKLKEPILAREFIPVLTSNGISKEYAKMAEESLFQKGVTTYMPILSYVGSPQAIEMYEFTGFKHLMLIVFFASDVLQTKQDFSTLRLFEEEAGELFTQNFFWQMTTKKKMLTLFESTNFLPVNEKEFFLRYIDGLDSEPNVRQLYDLSVLLLGALPDEDLHQSNFIRHVEYLGELVTKVLDQ